jgi:hypothetical protein
MPPRQWGLFYGLKTVRSASKVRHVRQVGVKGGGAAGTTTLIEQKMGDTTRLYNLYIEAETLF